MGKDRYRIGKVFIAITDTENATCRIKKAIEDRQKGYVCISNMRTVTVANTNPDYLKVMENSLFNTPDGTPLVWCGRAWGLKNVQRACGPHIFHALLQDSTSGLKHFFLGDTDETLAALTEKCQKEYHTEVAGVYSPPFKPLEEYDLQGIAAIINNSGANLVWTSLRAPKQDYLAALLLPYLSDGIVLVGVGAAFRFELGEYTQPEGALQKIGLAGLLINRDGTSFWTEFRWYIKHACYLIRYIVSIWYWRLTGKKYYE